MNHMRLEDTIMYGSKEAIIENLKDAGCAQDTIDNCITCIDNLQKRELLKYLDNHRLGLLDKVHKSQKQLDCLDYLIYQINRCLKDK